MSNSVQDNDLTVTQYQSATEFLAVAELFLMKDEALNSLLLGAVQAHNRQTKFRRQVPFFASAARDERLIAAAILSPARKLLVTGNQSAMPGLAALLSPVNSQLPGVLGPSGAARDFAKSWTRLTHTAAQPGLRQHLYKTSHVNELSGLPAGRLRHADRSDLEQLGRWLLAFQVEAMPGEAGDIDTAHMIMDRLIENGDMFVWETAGGRVVSMGARTRPTATGVSINLVFTPPEERGQGFATTCVAQLTQHLLASGNRYCSLFVDRDNPLANHVYTKIGYQSITDFDEFRFGPMA